MKANEILRCRVCAETIYPRTGFDHVVCSLGHMNLIDDGDGWVDQPDSFGIWIGVTAQGDLYSTVVRTEYDLRRCDDTKFRWYKVPAPPEKPLPTPATDAEIADAAREYVASLSGPSDLSDCRKLIDLVSRK